MATKDSLYIRAAIELAQDQVLYDPTDGAIVLAVEEIIGAPLPQRWAARLSAGILSAYNRADALEVGELENSEQLAIERSVRSYYGLN